MRHFNLKITVPGRAGLYWDPLREVLNFFTWILRRWREVTGKERTTGEDRKIQGKRKYCF